VKTDNVWRRLGDVDPYFGVLTQPEYQFHRLTEQAREEFFRSGEEHVRKMLATLREINPAFSPCRSLDFGCGVGRVTIPLARESTGVLGVDVAPGMLSEAQKNARERGVDNVIFSHVVAGHFNLVHSFIVFQHIAPRRGLQILNDLASRVEPEGMIVLQVPYHRDAPAWRKLATVVKRKEPLINGIVNLAAGRRFTYPTMTMFCYDVRSIFTILRNAGINDIRTILDVPDRGYASMTLYGENRRSRCRRLVGRMRDLRDVGGQFRAEVQVVPRLALLVDIAEDAIHLADGQAGGGGDVLGGNTVVLAEQAQVHERVRQREVELFLQLWQGVGVRRRRPGPDLLRNAQVLRQRVHLRPLYRWAIGFTSADPSPSFTKKPWSYSSWFGVPATTKLSRSAW
jgi:SAM-dependent methyltransferase